MIHTILPPEALLPLQELPEREWLPDPAAYLKPSLQPGQSYQP